MYWYKVKGFRYQMKGNRYRVKDIWYKVNGNQIAYESVRYQVKHIMYQGKVARLQVEYISVVYCTSTYANHTIQIQADSVASGTNSLLISASVLLHEERDTILSMLTIPNARCILWCLRSLSVKIRKAQLHLQRSKFDSSFDGRNSTVCLHGQSQFLNWLFFKILKFSGPSHLGMMSFTYQLHFLSGVYYENSDYLYPLHVSINLYPMTIHRNSYPE